MKKPGWMFVVVVGSLWLSQATLAEGLSAQKEQEIIRSILSIYEPGSPLLATGEQLEFQKCGTGIIAEAKWLWSQLSDGTRTLLKPYIFDRPVLEFYYDTPDGRFRIHYDTTGNDAVDMSHGVDNDGVPVYVTTCAGILQNVWQNEIDNMDYPPPPADGFYPAGETDAYDVYFRSLGQSYLGLAHTDSAFVDPTSGMPVATSVFILDNDYRGIPGYEDEQWVEVMSVTAAHEFFHAIQFGIDYNEFWESYESNYTIMWWHEMCATWMEDIVYDEINDYLGYLSFFFNNPNWALTTQERSGPKSFYMYAACLWPRFLSERFGNDIIRKIWEQCGEKPFFNTIEAMSDQIEGEGSTLHEELGFFRLWSYFTGDRYRSFSFSEGMNYPMIDQSEFLVKHTQYPVVDTIDGFSVTPEYLGVTYLQFAAPAADTAIEFKVEIRPDTFYHWGIVAAGIGGMLDPAISSTTDIADPFVVPDWQKYESVMLMVMPFSKDYFQYREIGGQSFTYEVSDSLEGNERNQIEAIRPNPFNPSLTNLEVFVHRRAKEETEVLFYNAAGELVRGGRGDVDFYLADGTGDHPHPFYWDGRNAAGRRVASGVYLCVVRLGNQISIQKVAVFNE